MEGTKLLYEYVDEEKEDYEYDLSESKIHKAIYRKSVCLVDRGNPLIEALPRLLTTKELIERNYKGLMGFDHNEIIKSDKETQYERLTELKLFRFPQPYQYSLSQELNDIIINSYRKRNLLIDLENLANIKQTINDEEKESYVTVNSDSIEGTPGSIAVLGPSGAGKSSSIRTALSQIPQVIKHSLEDGKYFTQITYVHASCNTSSSEDFSSLLIDIGRSVDKALLNRANIYERQVAKQKSIGGKIDVIIKLIDGFGIGLIVIDEVENLNFKKNKNASYSKLLSLMNITKVGLIFVGTNEVFESMFTDEKMRRRFQPFDVSEYQENIDYVRMFLASLFKYQWFDPLLIVKDADGYTKDFIDISNVFMEWTKGIVALMVKLYHCMTAEYIKNPTKVDSYFTKKVAEKYLYTLKRYLDNATNPFSHKNIKEIMKNADAELEMTKKLEANKKASKKVVALTSREDFEKEIYEKEQICNNVNEFTDGKYKYEDIKRAVDRVFKLKDSKDLSEIIKLKITLKYLGEYKENKNKKKNSKSKVVKKNEIKKENPEQLLNNLMDEKKFLGDIEID